MSIELKPQYNESELYGQSRYDIFNLHVEARSFIEIVFNGDIATVDMNTMYRFTKIYDNLTKAENKRNWLNLDLSYILSKVWKIGN